MQISENQMHLCHSEANVPIAAASPANQLALCWGLNITGERDEVLERLPERRKAM